MLCAHPLLLHAVLQKAVLENQARRFGLLMMLYGLVQRRTWLCDCRIHWWFLRAFSSDSTCNLVLPWQLRPHFYFTWCPNVVFRSGWQFFPLFMISLCGKCILSFWYGYGYGRSALRHFICRHMVWYRSTRGQHWRKYWPPILSTCLGPTILMNTCTMWHIGPAIENARRLRRLGLFGICCL